MGSCTVLVVCCGAWSVSCPQTPWQGGHGCIAGIDRDPPVGCSHPGRMTRSPERQLLRAWLVLACRDSAVRHEHFFFFHILVFVSFFSFFHFSIFAFALLFQFFVLFSFFFSFPIASFLLFSFFLFSCPLLLSFFPFFSRRSRRQNRKHRREVPIVKLTISFVKIVFWASEYKRWSWEWPT